MKSKPKIVLKDSHTFVHILSEKNKQLSVLEADALSRDSVSGLFPVKITPKGKAFLMTFDVTGYIPLLSYLKSGLRKQHFAALLSDVFYTLKDIKNRYFNTASVLLNHDYVFINPATKKVRFIFVPFQSFSCDITTREFYINIAENAEFPQNENSEYADELKAVITRGVNVSFFELEEFINSISEQKKSNRNF